MGIGAQQARPDGVECPGPADASAGSRLVPCAVAMMRSARRSISTAARREKVKQQDAARIGAVDDQMGDAMSQRVGLAGAGTGNDQQRTRDIGAAARHTMFDGAALLGIEGLQIGCIRHPAVRTMMSAAEPDHDSFRSAKRGGLGCAHCPWTTCRADITPKRFPKLAKTKLSPAMDADQKSGDLDAATALEAGGEYRVLRKLAKRPQFCTPDGTPTKTGIVLDIETTGLNQASDEIIELGMVKFTFSADGRVFNVVDKFTALREPSVAIPAEVTELTGIAARWLPDAASTPAKSRGSSTRPCW